MALENNENRPPENPAEEKPEVKPPPPDPSLSPAAAGKTRPAPLIIGGAVLIGILVAAVVYLYSQIRSQERELREEVLHRQATELSLQETQADLSSRVEQLSRTQSELETVLTEREQLREDLTGTRGERDQLRDRLETALERAEFFQQRLEAEEKTVASLNDRLDRERENQRLLLSRVERLMDERSELQEKISRLEERPVPEPEVAIPGVVVRRPVAKRQGTILAVNRRFDFAVVDLGERDGVRPGDRFRVIDRERVVGELVARRVEPAMTVADIDPERTRRRLRQDLTVTLNE